LALQHKQDDDKEEAVPKYISTDPMTVFQNIWNVLHVKNSSLSSNQYTFITKQFISFLKNVHCCKKDSLDPDKLEIMTLLSKINDDKYLLQHEEQQYTKNKPTTLQLKTILHASSCIKHPKNVKQSPNHAYLYEVYKRFLSHNDSDVASYAAQVILQQKMISSEHLNTITSLVSTSSCIELRDVLINYTSLSDAKEEERREVISILLRILFGRISSHHTTKRRKIQESPGRVRHVILSFLSKHLSLDDLDLWIYYMIRIFIRMPSQEFSSEGQLDVHCLLKNIVDDDDSYVIDVNDVPVSKIKGFLTLLGDVISKNMIINHHHQRHKYHPYVRLSTIDYQIYSFNMQVLTTHNMTTLSPSSLLINHTFGKSFSHHYSNSQQQLSIVILTPNLQCYYH